MDIKDGILAPAGTAAADTTSVSDQAAKTSAIDVDKWFDDIQQNPSTSLIGIYILLLKFGNTVELVDPTQYLSFTTLILFFLKLFDLF